MGQVQSEQMSFQSVTEDVYKAILMSVGSWFHHCGTRSANQWDSVEFSCGRPPGREGPPCCLAHAGRGGRAGVSGFAHVLDELPRSSVVGDDLGRVRASRLLSCG